MRVCWNRQTGTFEVRVSMTCGFKSHRSHHQTESGRNLRSGLSFLFCFLLAFMVTSILSSLPSGELRYADRV